MTAPTPRKLTQPLHNTTALPADWRSDGYFEKLLQRLNAIRASERQFFQKITDIFATSVDYMEDAEATSEFFRSIQNRLHYAIHRHSAAELIADRADASKPHMGLTTWKNAPAGPIRKSDVAVAKNYLTEPELRQLYLIVDQYLSFAELQALQHKPMHMVDWSKKLNDLLALNDRAILPESETLTHRQAAEIAQQEYDTYKARRRALAARHPSRDFTAKANPSDPAAGHRPQPRRRMKADTT
jgi:hypothetical protein